MGPRRQFRVNAQSPSGSGFRFFETAELDMVADDNDLPVPFYSTRICEVIGGKAG